MIIYVQSGLLADWSYEYSDYIDSLDNTLAFDSFMIDTNSQELGDQRQLTVDNSLVLPVHTSSRILVTSNDVIHSFAIPSLALKVDAIPGRLNSISLLMHRPSTFYGQCSEQCGVMHGFMPISQQGVGMSDYLSWLDASQSLSVSARLIASKIQGSFFG